MNLKICHIRTLFPSSSSPSSSYPPSYSLSIFISHFSTSQTQPLHSHSSSSRHDELSRQVKVSVWWDFESCSLPSGVSPFKISHMITSAVRANGIKGPVHITAFGDISKLSRTNQEGLSATGVNLSHVPNGNAGGKNSVDRLLLVDLLCWVSQNPPPAHLFLISGDKDFGSVLHRLRMNNYNVLLATLESAPSVLRSAASIMWNWNVLLKGENLTGKHSNQPPDGPYGSWYGHYRVPLEDPFLVEQPACVRTEESSESCSESVPPLVPEAVIKQIRQILNSYPKGISITDLRAELKKSNVDLDKDLYGYKKFSRFLLSMPHILKLQSERDGIFIIRGITPKAGEPSKTSTCLSAGLVCGTGDEFTVSSRSRSDERTEVVALNEKSRLHHSAQVNAGVTPTKIQQTPPENGNLVKVNAEMPQEEAQQPLPVDQKIAEASNDQVPESLQGCNLEQDSVSDGSFIRKIWQRWFGGSDYNRAGKDHNLPGKHGDSADSSEKQNNSALKKCTGVRSEKEGMREELEEKSCEVPYTVIISSSINDSTVDTKATAEASEKHTGKRSGFFNRIVCRFKFWSSGNDFETSSGQSHEKLNQTNTNSLKDEVFTQGSFWENMKMLIDSPRGSLFVTQSRTREEMADNLLKEGPLVIRSLSKTDLLHLVDLLISDKKWIKECPSQSSPFKIKAAGKSSNLGHSHAANGLRTIFLRTSSQEKLQTKHEGEEKLQNIPHSGVSSTVPDKKSSDHTRCQVFSDCQNLVKEIIKEHPEGYHMGNFRKLFLERYGYPLDLQRLGYRRLACLLEKIPGIKIESCFIIPASMVPDNFGLETVVPNIRENPSHAFGELPNDATTKGNDFDTMWDELGPVSNMESTRNELQLVLGRERPEDTKTKYPNYPSLSDDEFSDSKRDMSTAGLSGREQKPGSDEQSSSLLQILDSWYSSSEGNDKTDNSENSETLVDCSEYNVKPSGMPEKT